MPPRRKQDDAAPPPRPRYGLSRYWEATQEPLYSLLFLLPLVVTYEFTAAMVRPQSGIARELVAHSLLRSLFGWFGATALWLPGVALLLTLAIWHLLSRARWQIVLSYLPLMLIESALLTAPLFVLIRVLMAAGPDVPTSLATDLVHVLGAGLFEELVFRLYLITALLFLLRDVLRLKPAAAAPLAIVLASGVFAMCHFDPIGQALFSWRTFFQFAVAGVYLSLVFVGRGFGIAVGCHALYDLVVVVQQHGA